MTEKTLRKGGNTEFKMSVLTCEECGEKFLQKMSLLAHKSNHE